MLALFAVVGLGVIGAMPIYQKEYRESVWTPNLIGDVDLTEEQKFIQQLPENAHMKAYPINIEARRWPNNIVPYEFSGQHSGDEQRKIINAMNTIQSKTCFKFVRRNSRHRDYLRFEKAQDCRSFVGRKGGPQRVSLLDYCLQDSIDVHELMHALGMDHEHQRPDRDQHINVNYNNIGPGNEHLFAKEARHVNPKVYPYDVHSIMHYYADSYGRIGPDGRPMIIMTLKGTNTPVPANKAMSREDVRKLNKMGKCPSWSKMQRTRKPPKRHGK